jgi:hypothetical protein
MDNLIMSRIEKMNNITDLLKSKYSWVSDLLSRCFAALTFALSSEDFDIVEFDEVKRSIRENTRFFSHYRSRELITYHALLITRFDDPKSAVKNLLDCEEKLSGAGFAKSPYLGIAAYAMLITCPVDMVEYRIKKASEIYKSMKKSHFWLTGQDDYPLAILMAGLDDSIDTIINSMDKSFNMLHEKGLSKSGGLQFLSHIFTLDPEPVEEKVDRCIKILEYFKEHKIKIYSPHYSLIGLITLTGSDIQLVMDEALETFNYMKKDKGFKWLDSNTKLLISISLSCNKYFDDKIQSTSLLDTGVSLSMQAIIAAQTAAMIGVAAAASAAAAASTSH